MELYRQFTSREAIDAQYDPSLTIDDGIDWLHWYQQESELARRQLECIPDLSYGPTRAERLDIFPAPLPDAPVLVFFHGGYWRWGTSRDFSFAALGPVAAGFTVAVVNYALCPRVSITEIVRQARAALSWVWQHIDRYHGDRERILVAGHSAGAQMAAMMPATDWQRTYGLPADLVKGVAAISGIYDLRPLRHSFLQATLHLTLEQIWEQSPCCQIPQRSGPPLLLSVGTLESSEFLRQAATYHDSWQAAGNPSSLLHHPDRHHFATMAELLDPSGELCRRIIALVP